MRRWIYLALLVALPVLGGCKLLIVVPDGGSVTTLSGTYNCPAGGVCEIDVADALFNETFIAVPGPGRSITSHAGPWRRARSARLPTAAPAP